MSDFSGRTPAKLDQPIPNNPFYPSLNLGELQERYRIPAEYRLATIGSNAVLAVVEVNRILQASWCHWHTLGYDRLDSIPNSQLGDNSLHDPASSELVELYKVAVYARIKAKLARVYPSINRRDRQAPDEEETEERFLTESDDALKLLLGDIPALSLRSAAI